MTESSARGIVGAIKALKKIRLRIRSAAERALSGEKSLTSAAEVPLLSCAAERTVSGAGFSRYRDHERRTRSVSRVEPWSVLLHP